MIDKAKEDYPGRKWILYEAGKDMLNDKYDIVFSNTAIQWIPNHERLLHSFSEMLNENGVLAVQLPLFFDMPLGKSIFGISTQPKWKDTRKANDLFTIHNTYFYYDYLAKYFSKIDMWITEYIHVMESHESIIEMMRSTGLKPYLGNIRKEPEKREFENLVLEKIRKYYPSQKDGRVLFPFRRLFFIAKI
jgi:trans-aconitate 2-methyltransferase